MSSDGTNAAEDDYKDSTSAELALLLAGDNDDEDALNYDMRAIVRETKEKSKALKGSRKRKAEVNAYILIYIHAVMCLCMYIPYIYH